MQAHTDSQPQDRAKFVGSSESPVLLGVDGRKTVLQLWGEKTGRIESPDLDDNERVVVGKHIEAAYRGIWQDLFGLELRKVRRHRIHKTYPFIGASLDYEGRGAWAAEKHPARLPALDQVPGWVPAEGKNVDFLVYRDEYLEHPDGTIEPPPHIDVQVQHQLAVTGRPFGYLLLLVAGNEPKTLIRPRHEAIIRAIERECRKFWWYVENDQEPPADYARDLSTLQLLRTDASTTRDLRNSDAPEKEELESLLVDYANGKEREKAGKATADQAKARMLDLIGDAEKVILDGGTIPAKKKPAQPERQVTTTYKAKPESRDIRPQPKKAQQTQAKEAA
jgi:predicted phage-related endonuclease